MKISTCAVLAIILAVNWIVLVWAVARAVDGTFKHVVPGWTPDPPAVPGGTINPPGDE